jgi:hypothetical protein
MQRWHTEEPLRVPISFAALSRFDLEFIDVRRDRGSFTAMVFLGAGEVPAGAGREHERFAGSFSVFGPGECWGEEGHCDWRREPVSAFDRRPPHHLAPINVSMDVTETIRRLGNPARLEVSVHATRVGEPKARQGVLVFERLAAMAYV